MNIADGSKENIKPKNIGLMLFNEHPENIFSGAQIDFVEFEDNIGDKFTEKIFSGPVYKQLNEVLSYFRNSIMKEFVRKIQGRAEAERFYNYPYEAFKEALVNAVYHKSYEEREPVEVRVYPDRIVILSYPGPMPPLSKNNINSLSVVPRRYRNRRLGDFLKELHLAEGRSTGFPKIREALKNNGSPVPLFETDNDRQYFQATIQIHPKAKKSMIGKEAGTKSAPSWDQVGTKLGEKLGENEIKILVKIYRDKHITIAKLSEEIKVSSTAIENNISKLKIKKLLKHVGPDKGGHWELSKTTVNIFKNTNNAQ